MLAISIFVFLLIVAIPDGIVLALVGASGCAFGKLFF